MPVDSLSLKGYTGGRTQPLPLERIYALFSKLPYCAKYRKQIRKPSTLGALSLVYGCVTTEHTSAVLEAGQKMLKEVQGNYSSGIWECFGLRFQFTEYFICTFYIIHACLTIRTQEAGISPILQREMATEKVRLGPWNTPGTQVSDSKPRALCPAKQPQ